MFVTANTYILALDPYLQGTDPRYAYLTPMASRRASNQYWVITRVSSTPAGRVWYPLRYLPDWNIYFIFYTTIIYGEWDPLGGPSKERGCCRRRWLGGGGEDDVSYWSRETNDQSTTPSQGRLTYCIITHTPVAHIGSNKDWDYWNIFQMDQH